jgi:hypothetical protein
MDECPVPAENTLSGGVLAGQPQPFQAQGFDIERSPPTANQQDNGALSQGPGLENAVISSTKETDVNAAALAATWGHQHIVQHPIEDVLAEHRETPLNFHQVTTQVCLDANSSVARKVKYFSGSVIVVLAQCITMSAILVHIRWPACAELRAFCPDGRWCSIAPGETIGSCLDCCSAADRKGDVGGRRSYGDVVNVCSNPQRDRFDHQNG